MKMNNQTNQTASAPTTAANYSDVMLSCAHRQPMQRATQVNHKYRRMLDADGDFLQDDEGYRRCNCEDYPCCGH